MRCFFIGFFGFFIAAIVTTVALASHADYRARASLSKTMASIIPLRNDIEENIFKQGAITNAGASLNPPIDKRSFPTTDYLDVTTDGTIIFRSLAHGQIIVLEPSFRAGAVAWKCVGSKPEKNMQPDCR